VRHENHLDLFAVCLIVGIDVAAARAQFRVFTDFGQWQSAVGPYSMITFTELPKYTLVTTQYQPELGITFTDGFDQIDYTPYAYPTDEWGLRGGSGINVVFDIPRYWIGVEHPGFVAIDLYRDGILVFASECLPGPGAGYFGGIVADEPFDEAVIVDPVGTDQLVFIDNLHFGAPPCAEPAAPPPCPADITADGAVDVDDLVDLLLSWGQCPLDAACAADINGSCAVDVDDMLEVILSWGPCP
jgi:hypothetical protein